ncbi:MAG: hypothetical protein E7376_01995 [Clostridiales bacterium]|nr:hypothetical protein [Clostridiales bacterium]
MLKDEIKHIAKTKKVIIFFDMDGVLAEYGAGEKKLILNNEPNFYLNKRLIKTTANVVMELSQINNVTIAIMSNCYFKEQKTDKIKWLKKHLPVFDESNIHINVLNEINISKEEKPKLKGYEIQKYINGYSNVYLIEDQHDIIKAVNKNFENITAHHFSMLLD